MWQLKPDVILALHQERTLEFAESSMRSRGAIYLLSGCSTGKTLTSIELARRLGARRVLVVTTLAATKDTWQVQIERFTSGLRPVITEGTVASKKLLIRSVAAAQDVMVVINYASARLLAEFLGNQSWDMVIADECHFLKSHNSSVSQELAWAFRDVPYKMVMTATGWNDRPTDVYGQIRFLFPEKYRPKGNGILSCSLFGRWYDFHERLVIYYTLNNIKIPTGYHLSGVNWVRKIIEPFTLTVATEDVIDLPAELHITRRVTLRPEVMKVYRELDIHGITRIQSEDVVARFPMTELLRLQQITGGYYVTEAGDVRRFPKVPEKVQSVIDILDETANEPVVIFVKFREDIRILSDNIKDRLVYVLEGGRNDIELWKSVCETHKQAGKVQPILLVNLAAGSAGVDLTTSRYAIFYSVGFSASDYHQALWRVRRSNSDKNKTVTYWRIIATNTVDEHAWRLMDRKNSNKALMDKDLPTVLS